MTGTISLGSLEQFEMELLQFMASYMNGLFRTLGPGLLEGTRHAATRLMASSPEYHSLLDDDGHSLWHVLGVAENASALQAITEAIANDIGLDFRPFKVSGSSLSGGMSLNIVKSDYSALLGLDVASFTSENGFDIPWLEWLLLGGESMIIADYTFIGKKDPRWSRTGTGIMVHSQRGFHVDGQYAGTQQDNWITRALMGLEEPVYRMISQELGV